MTATTTVDDVRKALREVVLDMFDIPFVLDHLQKWGAAARLRRLRNEMEDVLDGL